MTNPDGYHRPVLLHESVDGLVTDVNGTYVDVTFGGGGHSREVLSRLGENGRLIAFDQDQDAAENAIDDPRFQFVQSNFQYLKNSLRFLGIPKVDGVLADLGVSSHQFDAGERGFSIRTDARLDMRMSQQQKLTAHEVVNKYDEADLAKILKSYGELKGAHRIANRIVYHRSQAPIHTTGELISKIESLSSPQKMNGFLARVFQALRIEVNAEMQVLESLLKQMAEVVKPGGRISVISYHSLEDRMVKRFIKAGNAEGELEKDFYGNPIRPFDSERGMPIVPTEEEIEINNRARSAKLRIATRNENGVGK